MYYNGITDNDIVASFLLYFGFSTIILKDYFAYTGKIAYYREQGNNNIFEIVINNTTY